jgi:hypothetical protein
VILRDRVRHETRARRGSRAYCRAHKEFAARCFVFSHGFCVPSDECFDDSRKSLELEKQYQFLE